MVLGKFIAAMTFFIATLALTLWYVLMLEWRGNPDMGPLLSGYLGIILYGGAAVAVGAAGIVLYQQPDCGRRLYPWAYWCC